MAPKKAPVFDVRVCEGRMCTAHRADGLRDRAQALLDEHPEGARCRLSRGGCFGLCDVAVNVVVRRYASEAALPPVDQDRLTLTERPNETVYSSLSAEELERALSSHLEDDAAVPELTQEAREAERPPESPVAARLRALRQKRQAKQKPEEGAAQKRTNRKQAKKKRA